MLSYPYRLSSVWSCICSLYLRLPKRFRLTKKLSRESLTNQQRKLSLIKPKRWIWLRPPFSLRPPLAYPTKGRKKTLWKVTFASPSLSFTQHGNAHITRKKTDVSLLFSVGLRESRSALALSESDIHRNRKHPTNIPFTQQHILLTH